MQIPPSLAKAGFSLPGGTEKKQIRLKNGQILKPLLIGSDAPSDAGKTEFGLSIPGIGQMIAVDRNFRGVFDNPNPPDTRNPNWFLKVISPALPGTAVIADWQKYHADIRTSFYEALDNPDSSAVIMDGDNDWWECHILAHFGKTTQIYPQTRYAAPNAEKRAIIARAFDSGKIVLFTNKCKAEYKTVYNADGTEKKDERGETVREKTGELVSQGFGDQNYLYQIWLRHMFKEAHTVVRAGKTIEVPKQWGVRLTKCKHNMDLVGAELWGSECNFRGLVELVYPDVDPRRWGFDK